MSNHQISQNIVAAAYGPLMRLHSVYKHSICRDLQYNWICRLYPQTLLFMYMMFLPRWIAKWLQGHLFPLMFAMTAACTINIRLSSLPFTKGRSISGQRKVSVVKDIISSISVYWVVSANGHFIQLSSMWVIWLIYDELKLTKNGKW